jgi:hypothetical protein
MKNIITILFLALAINSFSQDTITAEKAKNFMDKTVVVVGKVISYRLAPEGKYLNYINIDKAYPDNIFSIVITNDYLEKLNIKIEDLKNKVIYIKGKIATYKNDPKQIPQIYNPISIQIKKD